MTLWPENAFCDLPVAADGCGYLGLGTAYSMGVSSDGRTLLVAGGDETRGGDSTRTRDVASSAAVVDLDTARVTCLSPSNGLRIGRAGATITPLGEKLLVAGGSDPVEGDAAVGSAELFDPSTRSFDPDPIVLSPGRARHGAVALVSNEVLLVGGVDQAGRPIAEHTLDAIAAERPFHRTDLAELPTPRVDPVVLRLSDGRILVAGGTDGASPAMAHRDLLFLDARARSVESTISTLACPADRSGPGVTATVDGAFAAMPGGALLAVGGCTVPLDGQTLNCDVHCQDTGCPSNEVFWIDRDGNVACCGAGRTSCSGDVPDPDHPPPAFVSPALVPGEEGRPWLVEGAAGARRLHRFDPWSGQFAGADAASDPDLSVATRADAGLLLSIDDCGGKLPTEDCSARLHGYRSGVRGTYTQAIAPLLLADTTGVAMDRALGAPPAPGAAPSRPYRDSTLGDVELTSGSELVLTDTTYADVDLVIDMRRGQPPLVSLGDSVYGDETCRWPASAPDPPYDAELTRSGGVVTLTIAGRTKTCPGPAGRVSIRIGAGNSLSFRSIAVRRVAG